KLPGNGDHGVAVDTISTDGCQFLSKRVRLGLADIARSLIPEHYGEEHTHIAAMEVGDHPADTFDASGHIVKKIELVAIVDAHVRVSGPDEDSVDTAEALLEIVEIAVHGVLASRRIEKVAILNHHLRLHVAALRPLQLRTVVFGAVIADPLELLGAPALHTGKPRCKVARVGGPVDQFSRRMHRWILRRRFECPCSEERHHYGGAT